MAEGIRQRGDKWYVVLREPDPARPGKSKTVWHAGTTHGFYDEETARQWRDLRRVQVHSGRAVTRDRTIVSDFLDEWLPAHCATKGLKPSTIHSYREKIDYVKAHPIGQMQIQHVKPADIKRLYTDLLTKAGKGHSGLSARSVEFVGTLVKMAFRSAAREYGLIPESPAETVAIPRPRKTETQTWTAQQLRDLLEVLAGDRYGRMFLVKSATGARRGEMLGLRWPNVDLDGGWILFTENLVRAGGSGMFLGTLKSGRSKRVKIDDDTVQVLVEHRRQQMVDRERAGARWLDEDVVFCNQNGGFLSPSNLNRYWRQIIDRAGVPYRKPHALRHTHATLLLEAGLPAHVVAERLGNQVETMLKVYAHVTDRQSMAGAEAYAQWVKPSPRGD